MSGIAELLANLGYIVSGSDARQSAVTERLVSLGIRVDVGHDALHVGAPDVVVTSSAARPGNPGGLEASRRQVPGDPRAGMAAELMRLRVPDPLARADGQKTANT